MQKKDPLNKLTKSLEKQYTAQFIKLMEDKGKFKDKEIEEMYQYATSLGQNIWFFVPLGYSILQGSKDKLPLDIAVSVELMYKFTLLHDDILDCSKFRKEVKTFHTKYTLNEGIIMGDFLAALSFKNLLELEDKYGSKTITKCYTLLSEMFSQLILGELLDEIYKDKKRITESECIHTIKLKTAPLFSHSLMIGGMLAKDHKKQIKRLGEYGQNLGIGIQLQNDIKNLLHTTSKGTPRGSDISEKKKSLIIAHALNTASLSDKRQILHVFENDMPARKEVEDIIRILQKNNSIEYTNLKSMEYLDLALQNVNHFPESSAKTILVKLTESALEISKTMTKP